MLVLTLLVIGIFCQPAFAQLPVNHSYQSTLRDYLGTLKEQDFEVPLERLTANASDFSSEDEMYRTWLFFGYQQNQMVGTRGLRVNASHFMLDAIEAGGRVNMTVGRGKFMNVIATAFWADWNYKGNPHYNSRAVKLRAFVAAAVDMMMQDQDHERGNNKRSDFLGMQLSRWAYAYGVAKDELPQYARDAYEKGLIKMFERLEQWGPTGIHADMDMAALVGMQYAAKFVDSINLTQRAHQHIDLILDKHLFDAGYIDHGSTYDAGYSGISAYFINWAAQIDGHQPLVNALKKTSRLKAYMTLPDPDGKQFSPFHSNSSSGKDAPNDLWSPYNRDVGIANFSDDAAYLAVGGDRKAVHDQSTMLQHMDKMLGYFHSDAHESHGAFATPSNDSPGNWEHERWIDTNSLNPSAFYYKSGLRNKLKSIENESSSLIKPPFLRNGTFIENFADKMLSVKKDTYGSIIFNDRLSWWTSEGQTETINGFGGGNISAFWTPETGSVILGGTRTGHNGGLDLDEWRIWPVHALSGETSDRKGFSSGIQRHPEATYELNNGTGKISIGGDLTNVYSDPQDGLQGQAEYNRTFTIKENGIEVNTTLKADGSNRVNELYEILPVYKRNAYHQSSSAPTSIEFKVNGSWKQAGTRLEEVTNIRLRRFDGTVLIDFKDPVKVKLSARDFYQEPDRNSGLQARNIMIDLLGSGGGTTNLTDRSVRYFMRSSKAAANTWSEDEDGDDSSEDTTPPEIQVSHSPENPDNSQKITLTAEASDASGISQIELFMADEKVKTCSDTENCEASLGSYDDGTYTYYAKATDAKGNVSTTTKKQIAVETKQAEDTTPPEVNVSHSPENPDNSQEIVLSAEASDASGINQIELFMADEKIKNCTDTENCEASLGSYGDGTYTYYAKATDVNGNVSTTSKKQIVVETEQAEDTTPPEVIVSHSPENPDNSQEITLSAEASDEAGIKQIELFVSDEKVKSCTDTQNCEVSLGSYDDGTYTYYAKAVDKNDNTSSTSKKEFVVQTQETEDKTGPEIEISHSPSEPYENEIVTFTANAEDNSDIRLIEIFIDGQSQKRCTNTNKCILKKDAFQAGSYEYYVRATDNASGRNQSQSETKTVNVVKEPASNAPPASVEVKLQQKQNYLESEVTNISDPDGDKVNLNYDWRLNGESIAVINFPFDIKQANSNGKVSNYASGENNGITGNGSATPGWINDGKKANAYKFDGDDDFIKVPSSKTLENLEQLSIEVWIKHEGWGDEWASIISKPFGNGEWKDPWSVFRLSRNSNKNNVNFQVAVGDNEDINLKSREDIPAGKWTHITGTYDGEYLKLYINGKLDSEVFIGKPLVKNTGTDLFIAKKGNYTNSAERFKGALDELRVFSKVLTPTQVQKHYEGAYKKLSLDQTNATEEWQVAVTANDSKNKSRTVTSNGVIPEKKETEETESRITIAQNYPNPFSSSTKLEVKLKEKETMSVKIYDTLGRHVRTVFEGEMEAGDHEMNVNGQNLSSGIYFCRFVMKDEIITKKMMLVK